MTIEYKCNRLGASTCYEEAGAPVMLTHIPCNLKCGHVIYMWSQPFSCFTFNLLQAKQRESCMKQSGANIMMDILFEAKIQYHKSNCPSCKTKSCESVTFYSHSTVTFIFKYLVHYIANCYNQNPSTLHGLT